MSFFLIVFLDDSLLVHRCFMEIAVMLILGIIFLFKYLSCWLLFKSNARSEMETLLALDTHSPLSTGDEASSSNR